VVPLLCVLCGTEPVDVKKISQQSLSVMCGIKQEDEETVGEWAQAEHFNRKNLPVINLVRPQPPRRVRHHPVIPSEVG
jgi:hypothetical protein